MEKFQSQKEVVQHSVIATIILKVDMMHFNELAYLVLHIIPGSLPYICIRLVYHHIFPFGPGIYDLRRDDTYGTVCCPSSCDLMDRSCLIFSFLRCSSHFTHLCVYLLFRTVDVVIPMPGSHSGVHEVFSG